MTEKNSFQAVLERSAKAEPASPVVDKALVRRGRQNPASKPVARQGLPVAAAAGEGRAKGFFRPSREGTRLIAGHFEPGVAKQLKLLAVEEDTSQQALLEEALNDLFIKKGKGLLSGGPS